MIVTLKIQLIVNFGRFISSYTLFTICVIYKKLENNKAVNAKGVLVILSGYITFLSTKYMNLLYPKLLVFFVKREICNKNVKNRCNHSLLCPINE